MRAATTFEEVIEDENEGAAEDASENNTEGGAVDEAGVDGADGEANTTS